MDNFTKKPYEISLWDEQLIWERRILDFVQVLEDDYAPGKYYSQNSGAFGEVPFSLDFNEYNPGQRYYKLHSPQNSDRFETFIEGERPEDADAPASWLIPAPQLRVCNILKFEEGQVYYTYSNGTEPGEVGITKVVFGPTEAPQAGVVYFKEETNISMPSALNSYYKEYKLCTIGSDTMEAPFRATNGKFTTKINGENVLNFSVYYKYIDVETGQLKSNPFLPYLVNERKIKLRIGELGKPDCRWYDLIIKQIQENSENKTFQYTCKDQFVNELSKTGFELVFDNEQENNMGTVTYLGGNILEGSDWRVGEDNSILRQYVEEPLYEIKLKENCTINVVNMLSPDTPSLAIGGGSTVLVFYSHINEHQTNLQLLYASDNKYQTDDDLVIDKDFHPNYIIKNTKFDGDLPEWAYSCNISENYRGMRLVRQPQTKYDATIDKYVSVYEKTVDGKKEIYYGFTKDEYLSPQAVFNYIVNPNSFTSTEGWVAETVDQGRSALSVVTYPQIGSFTTEAWEDGLKEIKSYLAYTNIPEARIMNTSISSHRSTIKSLTKNKTWVVRLKNKVDVIANVFDENGVVENYDTENRPNIELAKYELNDNGSFNITDTIISFGIPELNQIRPNDIDEDGNLLGPEAQENYMYYTGKVLRDVSEEELQNYSNHFGLFISRNDKESKDYFIEDIELFPLVTYFKDEEDRFCVPGGEFFSETRTDYYYYKPNKDITDIKQLTYESTSEGVPDTSFIQVFNDGEYTKTRSINGKESNRFNLLQDLCEKFECWIKYDIKRNPDTGEILLGMDLGNMDGDEAYRQQKFIVFKEYLRDEYNWAGFRYGINEKSIQRTIDSNQIVSKMIVKDNANEFATNGFCSVARAEENDIKENFLLDFDYYYQHKLLNLATVTNDLYLDSNGYIGYYKQLRQKNRDRDAKIKRQSNLLIDMMHYDSELQTYQTSYNAAVEEKNKIEGYILELTGSTFKAFSDNFVWQIFKYGIHGNDFAENKIYYQYNNKTGEYYRTDHSKPQEGIAYYRNDAYAEWDCNKEFISYWTRYCQACNVSALHKPIYEKAERQLAQVTAEYDAISAELEQLRKEKVALNLRFYKKYSRFLQEGSWISEDYVDDNLYYLDAKSTLHTSAQPKVTYNISVLELSRLPDYENYKFELGDRTYIEDIEFFGYSLKDGVTPYREEIVINEISLELDSPEKNSIKVQNYKTQFDDLFSRITASTQQAEYHSGEYQRAANIIEEDGTIKVEGLEKAFEKNSIALSNAKDQSVVIDEYGITTSNVSKPDQLVRIISGGIYISNDGGQTWRTGITGTGINTSVLTSGQLNTKEILITNGDSPSFRWNSQGINAFYIDSDNTYDPARFVRFDQYGIYGINGTSQNNFDLTPISEKRIWDEAQFALTWKGFMLKRKGADGGSVSISSEDDFVVHDGTHQRIKIGAIGKKYGEDGTTRSIYGIRIADADGNSVMETNDDGTLWLKNQLHIETSGGCEVAIGKLGSKEGDEHGNRVIDASENFVVYEDGHMKALSGEFTGTVKATGGEFTGKIYATGGTIGNVTISEVETATVKLDIFSEMGYNFKVEVGKKPVDLELKAKATNINLNGASYSWKISKDLRSWATLDTTSNSLTLSYDTFLENSRNNTAYVQLTVTLENETKYTATQQILAVTNGETAINVVITSTAGNAFRNGAYSTTLKARLFKGLKEIDEGGTEYSYTWTKTDDETWSATGKEIAIARKDIYGNVVLTCNIDFKEQTNEKEGEGDGQ